MWEASILMDKINKAEAHILQLTKLVFIDKHTYITSTLSMAFHTLTTNTKFEFKVAVRATNGSAQKFPEFKIQNSNTN